MFLNNWQLGIYDCLACGHTGKVVNFITDNCQKCGDFMIVPSKKISLIVTNNQGDKMKPFNEHGAKTAQMSNEGDYILHGDVIVTRVKQVPDSFEKMDTEPMNALAYGELTGHLHQLQGVQGQDFDLRIEPTTKERHLRIVKPTALKHQEHGPIILLPGDYKVGIQREYDPFEKISRQVVD